MSAHRLAAARVGLASGVATLVVLLTCLLAAALPQAADAARPKAGLGAKAKRDAAKRRAGRCRDRKARALFRDTVATMARRYHLSPAALRRLNRLGPTQRLVHRRNYRVSGDGLGERLRGGVPLGPSTDAYVVVTPERAYGRPVVIQQLRAAAQAVQRAYPDGHRIVFEDISFAHGGCMPPHIEHRGGREVDAGLYHRGVAELRHLRSATAATLDARRTWLFLGTLIASGCIDRILLDRRLHAPLRAEARRRGASAAEVAAIFPGPLRRHTLLRHAAGHGNHAHIRFRPRCGDADLGSEPELGDDVDPGLDGQEGGDGDDDAAPGELAPVPMQTAPAPRQSAPAPEAAPEPPVAPPDDAAADPCATPPRRAAPCGCRPRTHGGRAGAIGDVAPGQEAA